MQPSQIFNELIKAIKPILNEKGFKNKKNDFFLDKEGHLGMISFQKSRNSTVESIIFTINIGVCSKKILRFSSRLEAIQGMVWEDCHWRERIGFLLPDHQDKWWTINSDTSFETIKAEVINLILSPAVSIINKYMNDNNLRDLWLTGMSPGLTDIQRLINLSILLKFNGPAKEYQAVLEKLNKVSTNNPIFSRVQQHLKKLMEN